MKAKIGGFLHLAVGEEATIVGTRRRDARRRLPALDLPRARPGARARHRPEGRDGRAVRPRGRHLARARRLDAPVRPRAPLHGRLRDRRRQPAARRRARARVRLQGRGLRHALHVRRRRLEPGHVRRDDEHRGAVEAAGRVPRGQQPVRDGHRARSPLGRHRPLAEGRVPRRAGRARRRHGRAGGARVRRRAPAPCARGAPADAGRGAHLPLPRPLGRRPRGLPHQGGGAAVARARPDPRPTRSCSRRRACSTRRTSRSATARRSRSSTRRSSSPTRARSRRSSRCTTTSTCSATRSRAGTRSTSARPRCTAARTSPRSASTASRTSWPRRAPRTRAPATCRSAAAPRKATTRTPDAARTATPTSRRRRLMAVMRYREALNQAMREEMRADESVFLMGEDVGVFQGAFKVTRGDAGGVRREARARHADLGEHDRRHGSRRGDGRAAPDRRDHDRQLRAAGDGPDHQLGRAHPLHVRRPGEGAAGRALPAGRGSPARAHALAHDGGDVPARARAAGRGAVHARGREGPAEGRDPRRQPGDLHRARVALRHARRGARQRRARCASARRRSAARATT